MKGIKKPAFDKRTMQAQCHVVRSSKTNGFMWRVYAMDAKTGHVIRTTEHSTTSGMYKYVRANFLPHRIYMCGNPSDASRLIKG
jgi:outer membrane protein assembly factor BamB